MLCSLKELGLTAEHDYPDAVILPAALLNDDRPLDADKPSIPADIQPGGKVFGSVVAARVLECTPQPDGSFHTCLDTGSATAAPDTRCSNLHQGDLVAYDTRKGRHLHAGRPPRPAGGVPPTASPTASGSCGKRA